MNDRLPVEGIVPALMEALAGVGSAVLVAEPGAGKTTVVPWRLLDAPWLRGRKIRCWNHAESPPGRRLRGWRGT